MNSGDLVRYITISLVALILVIFGMKFWKGYQAQAKIVEELTVLTNPTSSFEQKFEAEARATLFKSMHQLYLADHKHGKSPAQILSKVFGEEEDGDGLFSEFDDDRESASPKAALIRKGLERNYEFCRQLGLFGTKENIDALKEGKAPEISKGPASGKSASIQFIIAPDVSPGVENLIPNMLIAPPPEVSLTLETKKKEPTDLEIKQAKSLATDLANAGLFEYEAEKRIVDYYDSISKAKAAEEEPEGKPTGKGKRGEDPEPEFEEPKPEEEEVFEEEGTRGEIQDN